MMVVGLSAVVFLELYIVAFIKKFLPQSSQ